MDLVRFEPARGAAAVIRDWNLLVPIGTPCVVHGVRTRTWSHAGWGRRGVPVAWVEGVEGVVPLVQIEIDGLVWKR